MNWGFFLGGIGRALSHRNYQYLWLGSTASHTGRWVQRTAIMWLVWELTESGTWLGIVAFADLFPLVIVPLIAGVFTDRLGYLQVLRVTSIISFVVGTVFAGLVALDAITIELIVILTALLGISDAAGSPARISMASQVVPRADFASALGLNSASFNLTRIIGPALGAAIIGIAGVATALTFNAATFLVFLLLLLRIPMSVSPPSGGTHRGFVTEFIEPLRYIIGEPSIRFIFLLLTATALLIRPYIELVQGFVGTVFGGGPETLGLLLGATGFGAMLSALYVARRGRTQGLTRIVVIGFIGTAVMQTLFAATDSLWVGTAAIALLGAALLLGGVSSTTLVQNAVDQPLRARVMAVYISAGFGLASVGAAALGAIADLGVGFQNALIGAAVLTAVVWLWALTRQRAVAQELEQSASPTNPGTTSPATNTRSG